jgi:DNA modification methylase
MVTLYHGDCLQILPKIESGSIDAIITDLPYGVSACKWDSIISLEPMWEQVRRVLKPTGTFITTASEPFTSKLIGSNYAMFKYTLIWVKSRPSNFVNAKNRPLPSHEDIVVFSLGAIANGSKRKMTYNPQMRPGKPYVYTHKKDPRRGVWDAGNRTPYVGVTVVNKGERYPTSVLYYPNPNNKVKHPTQKPVDLYEYLIRTYTNEGETVLDICMGSGTTLVAAKRAGRNAIGIEKEYKYYLLAKERADSEP